MSEKECSDDDTSKNYSYSATETAISNELQKIHRLNNQDIYKTNATSPINQQLTINTTISDESCNYNIQKLERNHDNECCIRIMSSSYDSNDDMLSTINEKECNNTLYNTDKITNEIPSPTSSKQLIDDKPIYLSKLHNSTIPQNNNSTIQQIKKINN